METNTSKSFGIKPETIVRLVDNNISFKITPDKETENVYLEIELEEKLESYIFSKLGYINQLDACVNYMIGKILK